ncbi:hypothetical protein ADUPG1_007187, partial [Aduncisulcus paluster]
MHKRHIYIQREPDSRRTRIDRSKMGQIPPTETPPQLKKARNRKMAEVLSGPHRRKRKTRYDRHIETQAIIAESRDPRVRIHGVTPKIPPPYYVLDRSESDGHTPRSSSNDREGLADFMQRLEQRNTTIQHGHVGGIQESQKRRVESDIMSYDRYSDHHMLDHHKHSIRDKGRVYHEDMVDEDYLAHLGRREPRRKSDKSKKNHRRHSTHKNTLFFLSSLSLDTKLDLTQRLLGEKMKSKSTSTHAPISTSTISRPPSEPISKMHPSKTMKERESKVLPSSVLPAQFSHTFPKQHVTTKQPEHPGDNADDSGISVSVSIQPCSTEDPLSEAMMSSGMLGPMTEGMEERIREERVRKRDEKRRRHVDAGIISRELEEIEDMVGTGTHSTTLSKDIDYIRQEVNGFPLSLRNVEVYVPQARLPHKDDDEADGVAINIHSQPQDTVHQGPSAPLRTLERIAKPSSSLKDMLVPLVGRLSQYTDGIPLLERVLSSLEECAEAKIPELFSLVNLCLGHDALPQEAQEEQEKQQFDSQSGVEDFMIESFSLQIPYKSSSQVQTPNTPSGGNFSHSHTPSLFSADGMACPFIADGLNTVKQPQRGSERICSSKDDQVDLGGGGKGEEQGQNTVKTGATIISRSPVTPSGRGMISPTHAHSAEDVIDVLSGDALKDESASLDKGKEEEEDADNSGGGVRRALQFNSESGGLSSGGAVDCPVLPYSDIPDALPVDVCGNRETQCIDNVHTNDG